MDRVSIPSEISASFALPSLIFNTVSNQTLMEDHQHSVSCESSLNWQKVIEQRPELQIKTTELRDNQSTTIVSLSFPRLRARVSSYQFTSLSLESDQQFGNTQTVGSAPIDFHRQGQKTDRQPIPSKTQSNTPLNQPHRTSDQRTRIKPPQDMIRLQDRLFYMLQPPLEALLDSNTMEFPFEPFPFQFAGIGFLFPRYSAILADEMGLGKTMQTITTIRMLLRTGQVNNVLLICPKPLVSNWLREFQTWAPEIPVSAISGGQAQRAWHWRSNPSPVKIANYELLIRDEKYVTEPNRSNDLVVLDEAQRVKNKSNATSQVVQKIPRSRSWALTGTPIENGIEDLVGICEFAAPGTVQTGMTTREIRSRVSHLILRRTKDLVMKDMPPRLMRDAELDLTAEQWDAYQAAERDGVIRLNELEQELTIKHVFELVLRLKQICNFDPVSQASSKLERLVADMEEVAASGQKAIVFSQWVNALEILAARLPQFKPLQYHGQIPSSQRDPILQEFKENPQRKVLLMSYGAGSVGLNLQFCRYVFLFDRWWNPAIEDQAINRAHRIGAAGSVTITRMIMSGTIEQRIHEILEAKRELFREILDDQPVPNKRGLTKEEIFGLFNLRTPLGKIVPKLEAA